MITTLSHSWFMTMRLMRNLARQPWWIAITLAQPIVWLLLFAPLFRKVVEIPGFGGGSYINFLTPGVVVMTAVFSGGWNGFGILQDIDRGVMDRFLVSPASRLALIYGRVIQLGMIVVVQATILVTLGVATGARFEGGLLGVVTLVAVAILLGAAFGALSIGMSLLARREETVIAAVNMILLPLTFLSSVFMARNLAPHWMQTVARFNPVEWAVTAGREALSASTDWGVALSRGLWLVIFAAVASWLATRAFRTYQRSV